MNKTRYRVLLLLLFLAGGILFLGAHGVYAQDAGAAAAPAVPKERNVFQTIISSGPLGITIWCAILGASVTMVTFVIQNLLSLRNDRLAPPPLVSSLKQVIEAGNYQEAWEICNANHNYLADTLKSGLERIGRGKDVFDDALAEHGLREAQVLRTRNSYLSVIGVVSPMIGLLGTVVGMMKAFTARAGQQHRRGASGDRQRLVHRNPRLRHLLYLPQSRADGDRARRRPHQLPGRRHPFRRVARRADRPEFQRRGRLLGGRQGFAPRLDGVDDELPGLQRSDHRRANAMSALRRDARLAELGGRWEENFAS
jgi:biopolymer transport protein ExbB/TolQ